MSKENDLRVVRKAENRSRRVFFALFCPDARETGALAAAFGKVSDSGEFCPDSTEALPGAEKARCCRGSAPCCRDKSPETRLARR